MTVLEIIKEYLIAHGYDGLMNEDAPCGCTVSDLGPCVSGIAQECKPAYRVLCADDSDYDWKDSTGCWQMHEKKPPATEFFRCAECGDHVASDEYGCCVTCGQDVEIVPIAEEAKT